MNYEKEILTKLVNIYEKRSASSSKLQRTIKLKINKEKFPEYFTDTLGYEDAIANLKNKNYVIVHYMKHDTVIDTIELNKDYIEEIESYLEVEGVNSKRLRLLNELAKYNDVVLVKFKNSILNRIENNKSIKQYLNPDYIDAIKAIHYIEAIKQDTYERNLSNYIFNDSKKLIKLKPIIESIYEDNMIFEKKGILELPPYLYLKGEGLIKINNQIVDLSMLKSPVGISLLDVDIISFNNISKITTIENLTTFYNYESSGLIVYLGGFSTRSQMKILKKIKSICQNFYHFGDIDYGGFLILNNLMEELQIDIKAINMNLETLKSNLKYAQKFDDENYIKKLETLLNKPMLNKYYDVINYMIENKIWLEQESFYNEN